MASSNAPRIRRTAQNTQFTYNLSRRINDVQTYPVQSPQGATILIYGHENGVSLVWRGGKRFKPATRNQQTAHPNGSVDDSVMVIDSDDEAPAKANSSAAKFEDKPQFEDGAERGPYPEIVQTLDLTLGTAVLKVAVMPLTPCFSTDAAANGAELLSDKIVFAVSCVTNDVYVITLPITPPSPESKARPELRKDLLAGKAGSGAWGESLVLLAGQTKCSQGLAINLVKPNSATEQAKPPRAVVAAHSREASGVLRLWDIPLDQKLQPERPIEPFQTEFLPSCLTSVSFNPTHTTQLLVVSSTHAVRIYDFALPSLPPDPDAAGPFPAQGSWLLSLYQPFVKPSSTRKPVLDAAWVSHGRAVFALLADGMWGIWDVGGASPASSGPSISNKLKSGVRGAALTAFSVSGYVEGTSSLRSVATQSKEDSTGEFAPMTPHTRRQANVSLTSATTLDRLAAVHGGVKAVALPSAGKALQDETVALWVGSHDHVCVIPALSRFWDSQLRKGSGGGVNLFSGAQPTRMLKLQDLSTGLLGERCCGVNMVVDPSRDGDEAMEEGGLPVDVLIQGESRLVVVREGEDGPGRKVGKAVSNWRKRLASKDEKSTAIIVHGQQDKARNISFNLSTAKPGSLRLRPSLGNLDTDSGDADMTQTRGRLPSNTRSGLDFMNMMNDAADVSTDLTTRDVEAEMLDIMEIDQALQTMQDTGGTARKKVFFEEG